MSKQPPPAPTTSAVCPCSTIIQISRTPQHWTFTQHHRTTRPPLILIRKSTIRSIVFLHAFQSLFSIRPYYNIKERYLLSALVENFLACSHPILGHIPNTIIKLKNVIYGAKYQWMKRFPQFNYQFNLFCLFDSNMIESFELKLYF